MENNNNQCPCKRKCVRHGDCTACKEHHLTKKWLPACERIKAKEDKKHKREK